MTRFRKLLTTSRKVDFPCKSCESYQFYRFKVDVLRERRVEPNKPNSKSMTIPSSRRAVGK